MPIDSKTTTNWRHQVVLTDRDDMLVDGVVNLGSFDESEIIMETEQGMLTVKGEGLNIKHLNLEMGHISIEGAVKTLAYDDNTGSKKGLLERLLK